MYNIYASWLKCHRQRQCQHNPVGNECFTRIATINRQARQTHQNYKRLKSERWRRKKPYAFIFIYIIETETHTRRAGESITSLIMHHVSSAMIVHTNKYTYMKRYVRTFASFFISPCCQTKTYFVCAHCKIVITIICCCCCTAKCIAGNMEEVSLRIHIYIDNNWLVETHTAAKTYKNINFSTLNITLRPLKTISLDASVSVCMCCTQMVFCCFFSNEKRAAATTHNLSVHCIHTWAPPPRNERENMLINKNTKQQKKWFSNIKTRIFCARERLCAAAYFSLYVWIVYV